MSASVANADTADTAATSLTADAKEGIAFSITEVQAKMKAAVEVAKVRVAYAHPCTSAPVCQCANLPLLTCFLANTRVNIC